MLKEQCFRAAVVEIHQYIREEKPVPNERNAAMVSGERSVGFVSSTEARHMDAILQMDGFQLARLTRAFPGYFPTIEQNSKRGRRFTPIGEEGL